MDTDPRVSELLLRWQELRQQGQILTAAELCADCPELAKELERRLETVDHWEQLLNTRDKEEAPGAVPASFGKYRVVRPLGDGGHASTLLAWDDDLHCHVVLKLYHNARTAAEQEKVLSEGRALARVRSPYVARCHGVERQDGVPALVVEYIPGRNLRQEQRSRPVSMGQALELTAQLAEGLAAVHACGLLHRDLKPDNVLVGDDGRPRLVDFGLAAPLASADLASISGTLPYMAPEQARGEVERIDARTDVYGLGAVLYELLTGRPPHQGATQEELWRAACAGDLVPPRQFNRRLTRAANDLCLRCVVKDPTQRFASAAELAGAVRRLQRWQRWRLPLAAATLLLAALLVTGYFQWHGLHDDTLTAERTVGARPVTAELEQHPQGRELHKDFALKVEALGGVLDEEGRVQVLKVGQFVKFRVEAAQDCFVYLWDVTDSQVIQLFPNDAEPDNQLRAGQPRLVPGEKVIQAMKSSGVEHLHVVASTHPLLRLPAGQLRGGFEVFAGPQEKTRVLGALRDLAVTDPGDAMTEVILRFEVRP
jgi:hypothetical protein